MLFHLTSVADLTDFLVRKKITPTQAYFCHLIFTNDFPSLYKYVQEFQRFTVEELTDLEDRGYVINWGGKRKVGNFSDQYEISPMFLEDLTVTPETMGEEFWTTYPSFIVINATKVAAKSTDKDLLMRDYGIKIKNSPVLHQQVLQALKFAIKTQRISMGIRKWVDSHQWEVLLEEMKQSPTQPLGENEF